jgi:thymidine phosphorylase
MIPQEIIRRKRDGEALSADDIQHFIASLAEGRLSEGQIGAFAMAVWFKGMGRDEVVALTMAMARSGDLLLGGYRPDRSPTSIRPAASATMSR